MPVLLILPFRILLFKKQIKKVGGVDLPKNAEIHSLAWGEFLSDLLTWVLIGLVMGTVYLVYFQAPVLTGIKVLMGCLSFGLFGGMLSFLNMEKRVITFLKDKKPDISFSPTRILSVSKKMLFFMITVLVFMVLVVLLMVFMDIQYLLAHKEAFGPDIYMGVFKEILFAFVVLLVLSIIILGRYSQNLKSIIALQLGVMEDISRGNYDAQVPVVSNDEFGMIAAKTNEMVKGLKEKDFCQISFGRYVTPEVSERILRGELSLEGEMRDVTILFCDLRGYTPLAEREKPKEVVKLLNEYFTEMEQAIKQYKGIVLQYIGDEIEAVFGAPLDLPDHPDMAVMAALEMRKRLNEFNERRRAIGEDPIEHGIGIHTGEVLAGSVGSPERLVYAMVGDAVNIASRIQNLNKQFGTNILISQETNVLLKSRDV
ncbi:MAG: adenylate/guanylate cyclase domain-containing protein, partial [Pseudomonadota bacterium]